jgi:hypothetical protein
MRWGWHPRLRGRVGCLTTIHDRQAVLGSARRSSARARWSAPPHRSQCGCPRGIRMHRDISAPSYRHQRQLPGSREGVFGNIDGIEIRAHATAEREFDQAGALHQIIARRPVHRIHAIGNGGVAKTHVRADTRVDQRWQVAEQPKIKVAGSLRDHRTRRPNSWPAQETFVNRPLQAKYRPTDIPDGGKPGHQRAVCQQRNVSEGSSGRRCSSSQSALF